MRIKVLHQVLTSLTNFGQTLFLESINLLCRSITIQRLRRNRLKTVYEPYNVNHTDWRDSLQLLSTSFNNRHFYDYFLKWINQKLLVTKPHQDKKEFTFVVLDSTLLTLSPTKTGCNVLLKEIYPKYKSRAFHENKSKFDFLGTYLLKKNSKRTKYLDKTSKTFR